MQAQVKQREAPAPNLVFCPLFVCDWFFSHPDPERRLAEETKHWKDYHTPSEG